MKPPCILFLLDWQPKYWSTREEYFLRLSRAVAERGVAPVLTISEARDRRVVDRFESAGARVTVRPYRYGAYWRHIGALASEYDVRLAQIRYFDYFSLIPWMCKLRGIRAIVFNDSNGGEWRASGWKARLMRLRTRIVCAPLTLAVGISEFVRRRLIDCGIPESKTAVVYNGVDTTAFRPLDAPPGEEIRIAFASALREIKRPGVALQVGAELVRRGRKVHLLMMGTGPLRAELEAAGRETGARIDWMDHHSEPQTVIGGADVFLHTTVGEAFGNVLAEAMACGVPVVASRSGAAAEIIEEGVSGLLVPAGAGEISALAAAVERAAQDRSMRGAGIETARRRFSVDRAVTDTMALYEQLGAFRRQ